MSVSRLRFGSFEVDASSGELRKNGIRIHIEDQPFRVLWTLASREGGVVTRQELKDALWANDTHVDFDRSLNRAVNKVRLALGDSAVNPRFIETLSRRGYRLLAPVTAIENEAPPEPQPEPPAHRSLRLWALGIALVAAVLGAFVFRHSSQSRITSLAVLPLENASGDPADVYISDGITAELIAALSRLEGLRVVALTSVRRYKGSAMNRADIARELNVDGLVEGSVHANAGRVRLDATLTRFPKGDVVWRDSGERGLTELRELRTLFAGGIAGKLGLANLPEGERRVEEGQRTADPQLHQLYLRARFLVNEPSREAQERGIAVLEKITKADPNHAAAYGGEAQAWLGMASLFLPPVAAMPKAKAAARKAIELDPGLDSPRAVLALIHMFYDWDWQGADDQLQKALRLNPNSSDAYRALACLRLVQGRNGEAQDAVERALRLDPHATWVQINAMVVNTFSGRYDYAIRHGRKTLEWEPGLAVVRSLLGMAHVQTGDSREGIHQLETAVKTLRIPTTLGFLACGYARVGRKAEAEAILDELAASDKFPYVCPFEVAVAYGALGRVDDAYKWMQKGVADRADCMIFLRSEPWLEEIRHDSRYRGLVRSIGFPE